MAKRSLRNLSIAQLQREIERRQRRLPTLQARRRKLAAQLDDVDAEISALGGETGGKRRGRPPGRPGRKPGRPAGKKTAKKRTRRRPKNKAPLGDMLAKVMSKSKPKRVIDLCDAVKKAGYKTTAANFSTIVNQTLIKDKRFKKVGRGQYVLA